MAVVSSAEFRKNIGAWQDRALSEPVRITKNGLERLVLVSAEEYDRLKRRDRQALYVWELSNEEIELLLNATIPDECAAFDHEFKAE